MKNKSIKTSLLLATLLLSACGGGSSTSSPKEIPTVEETPKAFCEYDTKEMMYMYKEEEYLDKWMCDANVRYYENPCFGNQEEKNEFITGEYCANFGLSMMNTSSAYLAGASGEGITVAVLDDRVEATHKEFINQLSEESKSFVIEETTGYYAPHGTKVAGVIAAIKHNDFYDEYDTEYPNRGMQGVAYNAKILSLVVGGLNGMNSIVVKKAINYATQKGASVINMSFGSRTYDKSNEYKQAFLNALASDVTFVHSAGNDRLDCKTINKCGFPSSLPFVDGYEYLLNSQGGWIIVGAVDLGLKITGISNRAGLSKNNYVVALGHGAYTTTNDNGYITVDGTSLSAPHVSGVVALMKEAFPYLSGKEIADVIFKTATDLGEKGVDDIYGHGLVNVKKAFELARTL